MSGYRARARDPSEYRSSQHEGRRTSNKDRSEYSQGGSSSPPRRTSQKYSTASRNEDLRPFSYGILPQQRKEGRDSSPSQQWEEPVNRGASSFNTDPSSRAFREMGSSEYERRPSNIKRSVPAEKESDISPLKPRNVLSGIVQEPSFIARQRPTRTSQQVEVGRGHSLLNEQKGFRTEKNNEMDRSENKIKWSFYKTKDLKSFERTLNNDCFVTERKLFSKEIKKLLFFY